MDARDVLTVRREGDLLWATLADPERANALSPALVEALTELYRRPLLDEGVRALVLGAEGRHFSAGADLAHLATLQGSTLDDNRADSRRLRDLFHAVLGQRALTVALVQGACIAGGCGLATAHDFLVASDDARFMYSEVKIGFVAALVATFLPLRVRGADLRELLLKPEFLGAQRAVDIGLANRVAPADRLAEAGEALAGEVLAKASSQSIAATKRLLLEVLGRPLEEAMERAAQANAAARATVDCRRGIDHFLATKQPPIWR